MKTPLIAILLYVGFQAALAAVYTLIQTDLEGRLIGAHDLGVHRTIGDIDVVVP